MDDTVTINIKSWRDLTFLFTSANNLLPSSNIPLGTATYGKIIGGIVKIKIEVDLIALVPKEVEQQMLIPDSNSDVF